MNRFKKAIASGGPSSELRDRKLYDLSSKAWPELLPPIVTISSSSSSWNLAYCLALTLIMAVDHDQ